MTRHMKMPVDSGRLTPAAAAEPGQRAKVRRNLFGTSKTTEGPTPFDETIASHKRDEFLVRWGYNVETDSSDPNGPFEWERLDDKDVPEALLRLGESRARRYSGASVSSGEDACHSRSNSFSSPSPDTSRTYHIEVDVNHGGDSEAAGSSQILITDYLKPRAKRSRTVKGTRTVSSLPTEAERSFQDIHRP